MKRALPAGFLAITVAMLWLAAIRPVGALPEYSAQTGEPCATCHVSPSGGGLRTPRGQAWVGSGRSAAVPVLSAALSLLGVRLKTNEQDFVAAPVVVRDPASLPVASAGPGQMRAWLRAYEGN